MSDPPAPSAAGTRRRRRAYLDWLRGVAVLVMIEAHILDSWTRSPDRDTWEFGSAIIVGGMGAPLFLFLAGVAVSLSASSKLRRSGNVSASALAVVKRGLEVFGLAFLFRIQAWILSSSSPRTLLRVDILNIMGPSIAAAGALWGSVRTVRARCGVFAAATLGIALFTPLLRNSALVIALPEPVEAYFRPVGGLSNFVFLPWAAFVFAGALAGVLIDEAKTSDEERRLNVMFGAAGAALAVGAFALSFVPNPIASSYFWTTSPAFFFFRVGIMIVTIAIAYAWESRPRGSENWSPLVQLGRTSLFIYWIHVEMVYGLISLPLHRSLSWTQVWFAFAGFALFMLACSIAKDRIVERFRVNVRGAAERMMS